MKNLVLFSIAVVLLSSCGTAKKDLKQSRANYVKLDSAYLLLTTQLRDCHDSLTFYKASNSSLREQLGAQKTTNDQMFDHLKDLSVISGSQAESIKKSLDNIGVKDAYITKLQSAINKKDSMNMALVINLKSAIGNLDDKDINIKVDKGVVYVDISDKLLFTSGSYEVTAKAKEVLGKVAMILKNQPDIDFMVEGNTDANAFHNGLLLDNWDLSTKRATAVVRILQNQYGLSPTHMTAAGRGEYAPLTSNDTPEGHAANRRTRIVILPQLDQFFKLLEKPTK